MRHLPQAVEHGSRNLEVSIYSRAQRDVRLGFTVKIGSAGHRQTKFAGQRGVAGYVRGPMIGMINFDAAQSGLRISPISISSRIGSRMASRTGCANTGSPPAEATFSMPAHITGASRST